MRIIKHQNIIFLVIFTIIIALQLVKTNIDHNLVRQSDLAAVNKKMTITTHAPSLFGLKQLFLATGANSFKLIATKNPRQMQILMEDLSFSQLSEIIKQVYIHHYKIIQFEIIGRTPQGIVHVRKFIIEF